jgi:hypothetical protein
MTAHDPLGPHRAIIDVCLRLGVHFFWFGRGTLLISPDGISEVLSKLINEGGEVVGLEGFEMESTDIHPRIDLIYDQARRSDVVDPATIVATWEPNIWVDITLRLATPSE